MMTKTKKWADWQKDFQHGTFVLWPPNDVRRRLNAIRERYSPISQSYCEAHISLTQPLLRALDEVEWITLQAIVATFAPLEIIYGPVRYWDNGRLVYYEIQPFDKIRAIRQALHETNCFNLELPHANDFIPHLTLQEGYPADILAVDVVDVKKGMANYEKLKQLLPNTRSLCHEISFIVPDERFHFEVVRQLPLSGST